MPQHSRTPVLPLRSSFFGRQKTILSIRWKLAGARRTDRTCVLYTKTWFGVVKYGQGHTKYWKYKGIVGLITFERNAIGLLTHSVNECSSFDGIAPFEPSNMRILLAREWTQASPSLCVPLKRWLRCHSQLKETDMPKYGTSYEYLRVFVSSNIWATSIYEYFTP